MAISFDNSAQTVVATGNISYTLTIAGTATYLFVGIGASNGALAATPAVTAGGVSMTKLDSNNNSGWGWIFGLVSPPTGANITIAVTFTTPANTTNACSCAISLIGTDTSGTTTAIDVHNNAGGAGDPAGGAVIANATTDWLVDFLFVNGSLASNLAASNGQTIRQNINDAVNGQGAAMSTNTVASTGSQTEHYTNSNTNGWDHALATIKVGSGGAAPTWFNGSYPDQISRAVAVKPSTPYLFWNSPFATPTPPAISMPGGVGARISKKDIVVGY